MFSQAVSTSKRGRLLIGEKHPGVEAKGSRMSIKPIGKTEPGAPARQPDKAGSFLFVILLGSLVAGCTARVELVNANAAEAASKVIYVAGHGWHTGIVIARGDLPSDWPGLGDFPQADYLEFGWGDAEYYPAGNGSLWLGLKALFWPTPSVLHVVGIPGGVVAYFPKSTIVRISLPASGFAGLGQFIRNSFDLDAEGRAIWAAPGLYGAGKFYRAQGKFYFPKMCNYWTVSALHEAGLSVTPLFAVTAGNALSQAAKHGEVIQGQSADGGFLRSSTAASSGGTRSLQVALGF
jgi:uncharacterized protein (TIGR02117 family)